MSDDKYSKTMIIPNPAGRLTDTPYDDSSKFEPPDFDNHDLDNAADQIGVMSDFSVQSENIILSSCSEILTLVGHLSTLEPVNTVEKLRLDVDKLISQHTTSLADLNVSKPLALTSRYILCCLVDELVLSTPWGVESSWSEQTLLSKYHKETSGGEKFFLIINKLLEQPQKNIDLVELCYVAMALGFAGKYRLLPQGESELSKINDRLGRTIAQIRPPQSSISSAWQGEGSISTTLVKKIPWWLIFVVLTFVVSTIYIVFISNLKTKIDPVYQDLDQIGWPNFVLSQQIQAEKPQDINDILETLRLKLASAIEQQLLEIDVQDGLPVIRFISTALFSSGSSQVNTRQLPEVNYLVNEINALTDEIWVIGHTDSTGKATSNWVISRKRAQSIATWLNGANVKLTTVLTRGLAATQPLFDNTSKYNRSRNRRVELILVLKGARK